jgi:hypothetical protein
LPTEAEIHIRQSPHTVQLLYRPRVEKYLAALRIAPLADKVKRGVSTPRRRIHICTSIEEQTDDLRIAFPRRMEKRSCAAAVNLLNELRGNLGCGAAKESHHLDRVALLHSVGELKCIAIRSAHCAPTLSPLQASSGGHTTR